MKSKKYFSDDDRENLRTKGNRLKILRNIADLPRRKMQQKYGISANTLQSWESAKAGGLSVRGARRVLDMLRQEGVFCSLEWLLNGVGTLPYVVNSDMVEPNVAGVFSEQQIIMQELQQFCSGHSNALNLQVQDDSMMPFYRPGDYVAGQARTGNTIDSLIGLDCITELSENCLVLRRLRRGARPGTYDLIPINLDSNVLNVVLPAQSIIRAAPVLWLRRPDTRQ